MNQKEISAVICGIFLLNGLLTCALGQDIPPDFFIDETRQPSVVIVVGSKAASEDVASAVLLAAKVGCTCREGPGDIPLTGASTVHENIASLVKGAWASPSPEIKSLGFPTVDVPDAGVYKTWEHTTTSITYTLPSLWYFDDCSHGFWGSHDNMFSPWETHEEIQVRFDKDTTHRLSTDVACTICLHGEGVQHGLANLTAATWYHVPGLIYRADNIFVPPSLIVEMKYNYPAVPNHHMTGSDYERYRTFLVPEPWMVMHDMLPRFKLFNTVYNVVDGGMILDANAYTGEYGALHGTPFLLTGDPHFEAQTRLYVGEPVTFGLYTVELMAADIDGNKVWLEIYRGDESIESFWMVLNSTEGFPLNLLGGFPFSAYDTCEDVNRNRVLDPGEITTIIAYDEMYWDTVFKKWVVGRAEKDIWGDYRWEYYIDDQGDPWLLFIITSFVLDGIKAFIDVHGNLGVEVHIYWLEAEEAWYNHVCSDPFATEPDYQLFLDAYQSGWDIDTNTTCQPPGTGMWPPAGLGNSVHAESRIGNGFLDTNDGHTGYEYNCLAALLSSAYLPEQDDLDRDGGITTDCRHSNGQLRSNCTDLYDIEDPVVWHGPGVIMVELNISLCEKICIPNHEDTRTVSGPHLGVPQYFTIHVSDACFDGDGIDFETLMGNESINEPTQLKSHINKSGLVMTDSEFDFPEWKFACSYNLILIGGPVANEIVRHLVDEGSSLVAWEDSPGQWEYIKAPYNRCDILIVAGADRECTSAAVQELVDCL